jgi:hypothetical protein
MKHLTRIREWFWPLLEDQPEQQVRDFSSTELVVADENIETVLRAAIKCYEAEEDRIKMVDTKSSLFIGTITVITSVIIAVTTALVKETFNGSIFALVLLLFFLTLYMARTIWFSIRVLERRSFEVIDIEDYLLAESGPAYLRGVIITIVNKTRINARTINNKVDFMVMAQEYFKRAIVVVTLYSFVLLLFYVTKAEIPIDIRGKELAHFLNTLEIGGWHVLILYLMLTVSILLSLRALYRVKKIKSKNELLS